VVAAVLTRDGAGAEAAMRAHLEATRGLLTANLMAQERGAVSS
jgi:DNA-binding GntR family transcriptional regulator